MSLSPEELTASMHAHIPIVAAMGVRVLRAERGHAVAALPFEPNRNHFGAAYAGSLYTVAEVLGGAISRASFDLDGTMAGFVPLLKASQMEYRRPALGGVRARAWMDEEDIDRVPREGLVRGKAEFVLDAEIVDDEETAVATFRGVYQLRRI